MRADGGKRFGKERFGGGNFGNDLGVIENPHFEAK